MSIGASGSKRYSALSILLKKICGNLEEIVGDLGGETRFPTDCNDLVSTLSLLGQACLIAHEISDRNKPVDQDVLSGLHQIASVMGAFERDMTRDHVEEAVEVLLHMLEESALSIDGLMDYFQEYMAQYPTDESVPHAELLQALALRRETEFARVAMEEMGLYDDIPDVLDRIRRFDMYYSKILESIPSRLEPVPGLPMWDTEWWWRRADPVGP